ncbi:MAG: serpin family protein [Phycisphaerae bacterium]
MTHVFTLGVVAALVAAVASGAFLAAAGDGDDKPPTDGDQQAAAAGNTAFALDLYGRLRETEGNLLMSPYSVSTALAMTYGGARGETARQMAQVLHFDLPADKFHPAFARLQAALKSADREGGPTLNVANALWGQKGYGFLPEFLALASDQYRAGCREVDFAGATEQARQTINTWVDEQTRHKIAELLHEGDLDAAVGLVLTNAIHFKGSWAAQFDPQRTRDGTFHAGAAGDVIVPMMSQFGEFPLAFGDDVDVLELPYAGERLSMVIVLPKAMDGLAEVERSLSPAKLDGWLGGLRAQNVRVALPRFTLDTRFDLAKTLQAMGMTDAFTPGAADFSGMTGTRDLYIGLVIHQARAEVNEEGTEAAAGSAVVMKRAGIPPAFTVDHPFLLLIRDRQTGTLLFVGRVANPAE